MIRASTQGRLVVAGGLSAVLALACNLPSQARTPAPLMPITPAASATPTVALIPTFTATPTVPPSPIPTPYGCEKPPDDYTRVAAGDGIILNRRTLIMLQHAQVLYGGSHEFVRAVTQGSYSPGLDASFGTHDGGGAVDLAVRDLNDWNHILSEDFGAMILALRQAGFAAWVRERGELYTDSPIHIHAIAVGDAELSPAAQRQIAGQEGYFRGFNGLPADPPIPDRYGPPYVCPWMIEMGYTDLR